ncbi:hypothetical protein E1091_14930, partial [Micromonospora fluostatini]
MGGHGPSGVGGDGPSGVGSHGLAGVGDAGAFLSRLVRLDRGAVVRLRSVGTSDRTALWARLPWGVLVVRTVAGVGPRDATGAAGAGSGDATVAAGELLAALEAGDAALPVRRDAQWRWPLPPPVSRPVETLPAVEVHRVAEAAAGTLRTAVAQG